MICCIRGEFAKGSVSIFGLGSGTGIVTGSAETSISEYLPKYIKMDFGIVSSLASVSSGAVAEISVVITASIIGAITSETLISNDLTVSIIGLID